MLVWNLSLNVNLRIINDWIVDLLIEEDINRANTLSNDVEYLNQNRRRIEKDVVDEWKYWRSHDHTRSKYKKK